MPAIINWPIPNGIPMSHGDQAPPGRRDGNADQSRREIPGADDEQRTRQEAARREDAEAEQDLPKPRHQPQALGREAQQHEGEERAGDADRDQLFDRRVDHLVGELGVQTPRTRHGLGADQGGRECGGADPDVRYSAELIARIVEPQRLSDGREEGEQAGERDRGRAVAAELRAARHLLLDRVDIRQRLVQIPHAARPLFYELCNTKYIEMQRASSP